MSIEFEMKRYSHCCCFTLQYEKLSQSFITARKRSLGQGNIFIGMCQEFCSQGGRGVVYPSMPCRSHAPPDYVPPWTTYPPDYVPPWDYIPPPEYVPPRLRTPQTTSPRDYVPPGTMYPPDYVPPDYVPPGLRTPPWTVYVRAVRILLECILVL